MRKAQSALSKGGILAQAYFEICIKMINYNINSYLNSYFSSIVFCFVSETCSPIGYQATRIKRKTFRQ